MSEANVLIYLLRRDLRVTDNPILHHLATESHGFTHLLPIYVYSANQIEVSGFIPESCLEKSPYPEARSRVGGYWRCGPHRAKFIAQCVQNLKDSLEAIGSGLAIRVGMPADVISDVVSGFRTTGTPVSAVWIADEDGVEEQQDEADIASVCTQNGIQFKKWPNEKYYIDDRDLETECHNQLPDIFTTFQNMVLGKVEKEDRKGKKSTREGKESKESTPNEALKFPRPSLPKPSRSSLPPFITPPPQSPPFVIPDDYNGLERCLTTPLQDVIRDIVNEYETYFKAAQKSSEDNHETLETGGNKDTSNVDPLTGQSMEQTSSETSLSGHPFQGGEDKGLERLVGLFNVDNSTFIWNYSQTREQLLGTKYSTRLAAYLSQGCITARQIQGYLLHYENGTDDRLASAYGYGGGKNDGTMCLRIELLWRDYMRLGARQERNKHKLFHPMGFFGLEKIAKYKKTQSDCQPAQGSGNNNEAVSENLKPRASTSRSSANTTKSKTKNSQVPSPWPPEAWKTADASDAAENQDPSPQKVEQILRRIQTGTTGIGLIDASQRELLHTGYTSNRARQNVAYFVSKHLGIDWRYGAEWYEMLLVDYDVCSNWGNWQYSAGIGYDPRGDQRIFNPIKQSMDYDSQAKFVRFWLPEVAGLTKLLHVFQPAMAPPMAVASAGLAEHPMVTDPIMRIEFHEDTKHDKTIAPARGGRYSAGRGSGAAGNIGAPNHRRGNSVPRDPPTADMEAAADMLRGSSLHNSPPIVTSSNMVMQIVRASPSGMTLANPQAVPSSVTHISQLNPYAQYAPCFVFFQTATPGQQPRHPVQMPLTLNIGTNTALGGNDGGQGWNNGAYSGGHGSEHGSEHNLQYAPQSHTPPGHTAEQYMMSQSMPEHHMAQQYVSPQYTPQQFTSQQYQSHGGRGHRGRGGGRGAHHNSRGRGRGEGRGRGSGSSSYSGY